MVFQRSLANVANIPITGTFQQAIDVVQARVVPMQGGTQTNWQTIQNNPQGGFYSGSIVASGGWYQVEVRGLLGGNVVISTDVQRIGVGEVFAIAGQSNGQGYYNYGSQPAFDDRVSCVNYSNSTIQTDLSKPNFIHVDANSPISPRGASSWFYGKLGDLIASRYNVPVLFYNAGWEGTSVNGWSRSANGQTVSNPYTYQPYPAGYPNENINNILNYYVSMTGLRAVMWQQGEADNQFNTPVSNYIADLQTVINKSKQSSGKNIGWIIARCSYYNNLGSSTNILGAQTTVATTTSNAFLGPNTDLIQSNRPDGVHLQGQGLVDAGIAWSNAMDQNFFNNCQPVQGDYPQISTTCIGNNQIQMTVSGVGSTQWSNGANSNAITLGAGTFNAQARGNNGNFYFIPNFSLPNNLSQPAPAITADGSLQLCQGSTVNLLSSSANNIRWNTGSTSQQIEVSSAGTYSLTARNQFGCSSTSSINVTQTSSPLPAAPTISASGPLTFCLGGQVTLTSSSANQYRWSNGVQSQSLSANASGTYEVRVLDGQGCKSPATQITIVVNNLPSVPTISTQGNLEFCDGKNVVLSSNYNSGNVWNTGEQAKDITINKSGLYSVRVKDGNGCQAESNTIKVIVNPLPNKPSITSERPTTFCSGDNSILAASNAAFYNWSNGDTGSRTTVRSAGAYSLTVIDAKGCTSVSSDAVTIQVNPLPAAPSITASRNPSICQNESIVFTSNNQLNYLWNNTATAQSITVNATGNYSVRAVDANNCLSPFSNTIQLVVNALPPKPTITASGSTTLCEGQRVNLQANYGTGLTWSTFESSKVIVASTTAQYSVKYKDSNGCESVSDPTFVTVNSLPAQPRIVNERPITFCQDDNTILSIPLSTATFNFSWSTGESSQRITVKKNSNITASVTNYSTGCTSPASDVVKITVNPNPSQPTIISDGSTVICANQSVALTANEPTAVSYLWSSLVNSKTINVSQEGNYSVKAINQFGCSSSSSTPTFIKTNAVPPTPGIIVEGPATLCDGGQVGLRVESLFEVNWSTNETIKRIVVRQTGNYSARIKDNNGCYSSFSSGIRVDVKPLPSTPVLNRIGLYNIEVTNPTVQGIYTWTKGGLLLTENRSIIRVKQDGKYQAQVSVQYSPTLTCISKLSDSFDFTIDASAQGLGVYPNPTINGKIWIETADDYNNTVINVYSAAGRIVQSTLFSVFNQRQEFDLSMLPPGNYFIEVNAPGFRATKKILVDL